MTPWVQINRFSFWGAGSHTYIGIGEKMQRPNFKFRQFQSRLLTNISLHKLPDSSTYVNSYKKKS
ncbi:hypothetical protein ZORO111902_07540 [Zobellia roscoffensis]